MTDARAPGLPFACTLILLISVSSCAVPDDPRSGSATRRVEPVARGGESGDPTDSISLATGPYSDAHVHLIDFLQNGAFDNRDGRFSGIGPRGEILKSAAPRYLALPVGEQWRRITLALDDMDAAGVEYAMVSVMSTPLENRVYSMI